MEEIVFTTNYEILDADCKKGDVIALLKGKGGKSCPAQWRNHPMLANRIFHDPMDGKPFLPFTGADAFLLYAYRRIYG